MITGRNLDGVDPAYTHGSGPECNKVETQGTDLEVSYARTKKPVLLSGSKTIQQ